MPNLQNQTPWAQWKHQSIGYTHCETCLSLDNCWFPSDNKPVLPQHPKCHCTAIAVPQSRVQSYAKATSAYSKYVPYLFNTNGEKTHRKEIMLASWGYTAADALWLKEEIERQGLEKYRKGEYSLGLLNKYGQRISITIEIPRKTGEGTVSFISGWLVQPYGTIKLTTPYGGK